MSNMTSPVPLLKIPTPGANRKQAPRLKLGIPGSPKLKPYTNGTGTNPGPDVSQPRPARPAPPQLRLATPMGSKGTPQEAGPLNNGRPSMQPLAGSSATTYNSDYSNHSRSGSFTTYDGRASGPTSATSSNYSALSFAMGLRHPPGGTPDPTSAISSVYSDRGDGGLSMERDNSINGMLPDLEKLSLEKGRPLDVEDLDDEGWLAASSQKKIIELDSLGEGAGGAVTRCMLKGGKTVFALKVGHDFYLY